MTSEESEDHKIDEQELLYRSIFEGSVDGIVFINEEGRFVDCNRAFEEMLGYTKAELRELNFFDITPERWHQWEQREIVEKQLLARGYCDTYEKEYIRKDGTVFPVELTSYRLGFEVNGLRLLWGAVRDITDRKKAEIALNRKNEQLFLLKTIASRANEANSGIEIFPKVLDELCEFTGWDIAAILPFDEEAEVLRSPGIYHIRQGFQLKESFFEAYTTQYAPGQNLPGRVYQTGQPEWVTETDILSSPEKFRNSEEFLGLGLGTVLGHPIRIDETVVAVMLFGSRKVRVPDEELLGLLEDVSLQVGRVVERERTREALRLKEEYFRAIADYTYDWEDWIDLDGNLLWVNPAVQRITGYTVDECFEMERYPLSFVHEDHRDEVARWLDEARLGWSGDDVQFRIVRKNGELRWIAMSWQSLLDDQGSTLGHRSSHRDITEQKKSQHLLVQTEKMRSVAGLTAGLAHELNNPLGAILWAVENTFNRVSSDFEANRSVAEALGLDLDGVREYMEQREITSALNDIRECSKRASSFVRNMLDFSRHHPGEMKKESIEHLIDIAIELAGSDYDLKKKYDFRSIRITREFEGNLPRVSCIGQEIQQVLLNLFKNAAQSLREEETSTETPQITIKTFFDQTDVGIVVQDNGRGMDEDTRRRAFEPFFTTKQMGEGSGLGLYVSHLIMTERHQGCLDIESEPDLWTKFTLRLPLEQHNL